MGKILSKGPSSKEQELLSKILEFKYDPAGYILYAFPWGTKNTPLANFSGPRQWQLDVFESIRKHLMVDLEKSKIGLPSTPVYLAISSGRGIGKSAMLAMLNMWVTS